MLQFLHGYVHVFEIGFGHREPTQSICIADCYFIVNVLDSVDLPFASPIARHQLDTWTLALQKTRGMA